MSSNSQNKHASSTGNTDKQHSAEVTGNNNRDGDSPPILKPSETSKEPQIPSSNKRTDEFPTTTEAALSQCPSEPPYSIFSMRHRMFYAWVASIAAFASPVSSAIYYPALNSLATDLNTSIGNINLTITAYLIFQAIAPTLVGGLSDRFGRRPALVGCFVVYMGANIGLALQNSYAALLVLRCVQSAGSSGTVALSNGVVSDFATRSERGRFIGLASLGSTLGPTLGPLIGGLLDHFLGWRAIFWFLVIYAGVMLVVILCFFPETCRNIVGNGSVPPQRWNYSLTSYLQLRKSQERGEAANTSTISTKHRASIISSLYIICTKEAFLLLFCTGLCYAGFYIVIANLAPELQSKYNYNSIQVGLCYIPMGAGSIAARLLSGKLIDSNFRRHARRLGVTINNAKQTNITAFPVEQARLAIAIPMAYIGCGLMVAYCWVFNLPDPPLPAVLVLLFFLILVLSSALQAISTLLIDCYPDSPSAATAASNLMRCGLGAGGVALLNPMQNALGFGWMGTLIAGIWLLFSICWWLCWFRGMRWREERRVRIERKEKLREKKKTELGGT